MEKNYRRFIGIAIVLVLIGMPMFSYLFLRNGLSFRMEALEVLKVDENDKELTKSLSGEYDPKYKLVDVLIDSREMDIKVIDDLYNKYKGNKYFHLTTYGEIENLGEKHRNLSNNVTLDPILNDLDIILIDTSGQVRHSYEYSQINLKDFVQHLTVLLPVEASKKIKLDRK